jgi:hypothetical protein
MSSTLTARNWTTKSGADGGQRVVPMGTKSGANGGQRVVPMGTKSGANGGRLHEERGTLMAAIACDYVVT